MDDSSPAAEPPKESMGVGPMVAIVILVLLFLVGGVYFFLQERSRLQAPPVHETINA